MITGDREATAEAIARQAGIERVLAEVLPRESRGDPPAGRRAVAMVGDRRRCHHDAPGPPAPADRASLDAVAHHRHMSSGSLQLADLRHFSAGSTSASTRSIPTWPATACGRRGASPVIIHTSIPMPRRRRTASAASGLMVSAISMQPAARAVDRHRGAGRPTITSCPPHARARRGPPRRRNSVASSSAMPRAARRLHDRLAERVFRIAFRRCRQPQHFALVETAVRRDDAVTRGLPR